MGAMLLAYVANVYGSKVLPYWQNAVMAIHILAYFGFLIPVWVNAPKATHAQVWGSFENEGGWSTLGLAILVGQLSGISQQTGIDTASHMSEEVVNAASTIPRTMLSVYLINMLLMFPAIVTVCYHIPDLDAALGDSTTYPAIYVLRQSMSGTTLDTHLRDCPAVADPYCSRVDYCDADCHRVHQRCLEHCVPGGGDARSIRIRP